MTELSTLYNRLRNLIKQNFYDKNEIDTYVGDINDYIDSNVGNVLTSEVTDTVSDGDYRPVSSNAVYDALQDVDVDLEDALEDLIDSAIEEETNNEEVI